ncbi:MAG: hypothetical protein IBX56_15745, partial [Methylomicrobium sp.]|nr:hypothetical protein [Methylomicrobium sp.]
DQHGTIERTVKPSELTEQQRQTLVEINFSLDERNTGAKIDGTESITELLDKAYNKILADQEKEQKRIDEAVKILTRQIIENSASNPHHIHEKTGLIEIQPNRHALIQVSVKCAAKVWNDSSFFKSMKGLYFGKEKSIKEIRDRVLSNPGVTERIASLEKVADHIQKQLDEAKVTRERIAAEHKAATEKNEVETKARQHEQLCSYVKNRMPEIDQRKFEAGLLPGYEILYSMADYVFKPLEQFEVVDRAALYADARDYLSEYGGTVQEITRVVIALTDEQFMLMEAIKKAVASSMPGATVEPLKLVLYSSYAASADDPEIEYTIARVSIRHGEFDFQRDFMLPESNGSEEV